MTKKEAPAHVAIIMDGNGRWAKQRNLPRMEGHRRGIEALRCAVEGSVELGVKILTVYVFSTENWKRPETEVTFLMRIFEELIEKEVDKLHKNGVKVKFLGKIVGLSPVLREKIKKSEEKTKKNEKLLLNIMINYGSRQEIVDAAKEIVTKVSVGELKTEEITPEVFAEYLYTRDCPDPDLLIRTGGDHRVSNFLLWQISYAEIYVTDIFWPDFDKSEYEKAVMWFNKRQRRFGGL